VAHAKTPGEENARKQARSSEAERLARLAQLVLCRTKLSASEAVLLREVFPEILATHHEQVWSQLRRRGLSGPAAEDLLQDVFLLLHSQILEHGFPDNVPGLLHRLTEGKLLNHVRAQKRDIISIGLPSSGSEPPKTGPEAERALDLKELARRLLPMLSDEHREVVEMVILNGLPHTEAATALGIATGTLKSRLIAAKHRLFELLEQLLPPSQRGAS